MMKKPVLASTDINYYGNLAHLIVHGGLRHIKGNHAPHFSITGEVWIGQRSDCEECGCLHDRILKHFPQFADIVSLHLSDIDGVPMYAVEDGWYDLAGALPGNAGQKYHTGNSERHFPKPVGAARRRGDWDNTDYRLPTPDECLEAFARHARVDVETARTVRDSIVDLWMESRVECQPEVADDETDTLTWGKKSWSHARAWFTQWIEEQKPRWKMEAETCIAKHGLVVFGDTWPVKSEVS